MAVDFLRRCYRSSWYLFRDAPKTATPGRYYFNDDAPAYEGEHLYGSRNWYPESHEIAQGLGERLDTPQPWIEGDRPAWAAQAQAVGSALCIAQGADIANAIPYAATFDGIIENCVVKVDPDAVLWNKVSDYNNCQVQRMYSFILVAMYSNDVDSIVDVLRNFVGAGPTISFRPSSGVFNGIVTVTSSTWQLAIINGTENKQQFALQAFSSVRGPSDVGGFSTSPFWFAASSACADKMIADGQTPNMRVMLVGDSYGGAVSLLVAARNRQASDARKIAFLTFGCPKIGDARLVNLVRTCNGLNISNDGDLITILPPDKYLLGPLIPLFPLFNIALWGEWQRAEPQALLRSDGSLTPNLPTPVDTLQLFALITSVLANRQLDVLVPHYVITYNERLFVRCPDCCFPCQDAVCEEIIITNPALTWTIPTPIKSGIVWRPGVPLAVPIAPGPPPFPTSVPFFMLGILYVYMNGIQTPAIQGLQLADIFAGTYRLTIISTDPMSSNQGIQAETLIPPDWDLDQAHSIHVVGHVDVIAHADGETLLLIFFDIDRTNGWNIVFRVDKIA